MIPYDSRKTDFGIFVTVQEWSLGLYISYAVFSREQVVIKKFPGKACVPKLKKRLNEFVKATD